MLIQPVQRRVWQTLPLYPIGTRGRILQRRIFHSEQHVLAAAAEITKPRLPTEDDIVPRIPMPKIFRENPALAWSPSTQSAAFIPPTETTPPEPEYLHPQSHPPQIRSLLLAISHRAPESIWHSFSTLTPAVRAHLTPSILSHVLLSLRPKAHLVTGSRAYFDYYHPSYSPSQSAYPLARLPKEAHAQSWLMSRVSAVLSEYRHLSIPLGTLEYAHLLDIARATENITMARDVWAEMDTRGVKKDTKCYNTYLAALCGTTLTEATWRTSVRTVHVRARRKQVGDKEVIGDVGSAALKVLDNMLRDGLVPDTATFEFVLLAVARMGNLPVLKALISRCWGVDISSSSFVTSDLSSSSNSSQPSTMPNSPPAQFTSNPAPSPSPSSTSSTPLHLPPTPQTLTNLSVLLSRLSHPSIAIRLVNHLSITYSVPIPTSTWHQILTWTYILTRPPAHSRVLPDQTMTNLWSVMTNPPYSVEPDIEMYDLIIRHHLRGQRYIWAEQLITEALSRNGPWKHLNKKFSAYRLLVEKNVGWGLRRSAATTTSRRTPTGPSGTTGTINNIPLLERRNHLPQLNQTTPLTSRTAGLDFEIFRARSIIKRWLELLIYSPTFSDDSIGSFKRRNVPILINTYGQEFLGSAVGYKLGEVGYVYLRSLDGVLGMWEGRNSSINLQKQSQQKQLEQLHLPNQLAKKLQELFSLSSSSPEAIDADESWSSARDNPDDPNDEPLPFTPPLVPLLGTPAPSTGIPIDRKSLPIHRQRESVRWRWKNRGIKYGEWREGCRKGEGVEAVGGEGVLGVDRTRLGPPERSKRLGFVR